MVFATPVRQAEAYDATPAQRRSTSKKRPNIPGKSKNRRDRFRFRETKELRERMVEVARALNGHWTDHLHPEYPNRPVNKYEFIVSVDHRSITKDGIQGEGFVQRLSGTIIYVEVFSKVENALVCERPFSFRVDVANPDCVIITNVHIKGGKSGYQDCGHASFTISAALSVFKKKKFSYATIMSPTIRGSTTYRKIGFNSYTRSEFDESKAKGIVPPHRALRLYLKNWSVKKAHTGWKRDSPKRTSTTFRLAAHAEKRAHINIDGYFSQNITPPIPNDLRMDLPDKNGKRKRPAKKKHLTVKRKANPEARRNVKSSKAKLKARGKLKKMRKPKPKPKLKAKLKSKSKPNTKTNSYRKAKPMVKKKRIQSEKSKTEVESETEDSQSEEESETEESQTEEESEPGEDNELEDDSDPEEVKERTKDFDKLILERMFSRKLQFLELGRNRGDVLDKYLEKVPAGLWVTPDLPKTDKPLRGPLPKRMKMCNYLVNKEGKQIVYGGGEELKNLPQCVLSLKWPVDSRFYDREWCKATNWLRKFSIPESSIAGSQAVWGTSSSAFGKPSNLQMRFYCRIKDEYGRPVEPPRDSPYQQWSRFVEEKNRIKKNIHRKAHQKLFRSSVQQSKLHKRSDQFKCPGCNQIMQWQNLWKHWKANMSKQMDTPTPKKQKTIRSSSRLSSSGLSSNSKNFGLQCSSTLLNIDASLWNQVKKHSEYVIAQKMKECKIIKEQIAEGQKIFETGQQRARLRLQQQACSTTRSQTSKIVEMEDRNDSTVDPEELERADANFLDRVTTLLPALHTAADLQDQVKQAEKFFEQWREREISMRDKYKNSRSLVSADGKFKLRLKDAIAHLKDKCFHIFDTFTKLALSQNKKKQLKSAKLAKERGEKYRNRRYIGTQERQRRTAWLREARSRNLADGKNIDHGFELVEKNPNRVRASHAHKIATNLFNAPVSLSGENHNHAKREMEPFLLSGNFLDVFIECLEQECDLTAFLLIEKIVASRWKSNNNKSHNVLIATALAVSAKYHGASNSFINLMSKFVNGPTADAVRMIIRQMAANFIANLDERLKCIAQSTTTPLDMSGVPLDVLRLGTDIRRQFDANLLTDYAITQQSVNLQESAYSVQWALVVMQDNHNPISIQRTIQIGGLAINNSMVSRLYTLLRIQPAKLPDETKFYGLNFHPKRNDISKAVNFDVLEAALKDFETNSFGANEDDQKPEHDPIVLREKLKRHLNGQESGLKNLMPTMDELRPIYGYKSGFLEGSEAPFDADKIKTGVSLRKDFCPSPHRRGVTSRSFVCGGGRKCRMNM